MDDKILWSKVLNNISNIVDPLSFDTWFKNIDFLGIENSSVRLVIPIMWYKNHIDRNYKDIILNSFNELSTKNVDSIKYILKDNVNDILEKEKSINQEDIKLPNNEKAYIKDHVSNLNKNYTFESFVVGESNKFAQAAALAVAENPGTMYNPLFIYGNSGLGKTHLMHAIGNYIVEKTNKKVLYVSSDTFINDWIGINIKNNGNNFDKKEYFNNKYRNVDVLIIDDIQFLGNAPKSQDAFFHTFNTLFDNKKQIIISSDNSPDDLKNLEDRLRTRFNWGLKVNIFPPDNDLRKKILHNKLSNMNFAQHMSEEAIDYIANTCQSDVRKLEGALTRVCAYATIFFQEEITLETAIEALKGNFSNNNTYGGGSNSYDISRIQKAVANYYNVTVEDLKSKKRVANIAFPRHIAIYLSRQLTDESFPRIGMEFGGRDHSTVMSSCDKIEEELKNNKQLEKIIEEIKKRLE